MNDLRTFSTLICSYYMGCYGLLLAGSTFNYDGAVLSKSNAI